MSWLTKFLGYDFTIDRLESQVQDYRDLVRVKDEHFVSMLEIKDEEIRRLTDLMLVEHGMIHPEVYTQIKEKEKPQPVGRRASFRTIRNKFEAADAKMAQEIAKDQSEKLRDYWGKKDQVAQQEGVV